MRRLIIALTIALPLFGQVRPSSSISRGTADARYQFKDTELTALAGLNSAADRLAYFTGSGTATLTVFTAAGRALLDDADATAQRVTLGLVIGTNVQAHDTDLDTWAANPPILTCYIPSPQTNATATLATTNCNAPSGSGISVTSGRKYTGLCRLFLFEDVGADGAQIDFGGGTATATYFRAHITAFDTALALTTQVSTLTSAASAATFGLGAFEVHFAFEPSSTGTFMPRFAQAAHSTGTLTLLRGSSCTLWDHY